MKNKDGSIREFLFHVNLGNYISDYLTYHEAERSHQRLQWHEKFMRDSLYTRWYAEMFFDEILDSIADPEHANLTIVDRIVLQQCQLLT